MESLGLASSLNFFAQLFIINLIKRKTMLRFSFFAILLLAFTACEKEVDDTPTPLQVITVSNLAADPTTNATTGQPQAPTGNFTLYSLKNNAIVPNSDSATNKWDIGFRGTTIIVNGGSIRSGQGGAYIFSGLLEDLTAVPEGQVFGTDESVTQLAIPTGAGNGWYNYSSADNWISPIPGKILVIRTGEGKFAKVQILSYYYDAPSVPSPTARSRYYTFKYVYQDNGSRQF